MTAAGSLASGLASAATWGAGDFAGGMAARRLHVLRVVFFSQLLGLAAIALLAVVVGEPLPPRRDLAWAGAAGLSGAVGVSCLYASLAAGRMGVAAPLTGVVAALIPVSYAWSAIALPGPLGILGTVAALGGIALVAGPRAERPSPRVLALAVTAGLGFAGFLLLMGLAGDTSFLWLLAAARVASATAVFFLVLWRRPPGGPVGRAVLATGLLDAAGNAFFLLAARLGPLDLAVVVSSFYPAATLILARVWLKERLSATQRWGAALMLAALPLIALG